MAKTMLSFSNWIGLGVLLYISKWVICGTVSLLLPLIGLYPVIVSVRSAKDRFPDDVNPRLTAV
jgi:hypothetical protein